MQDKPIAGAILLFTDGSSNGMAAIVRNSQRAVWPTGLWSAQAVELTAVLRALHETPSPFNLYSDSQYVVTALLQIETVPFIGTTTSEIQQLFRAVQAAIQKRDHPCFFSHIRAHSRLPGPLAQGNKVTD